MHIVWIKHAPVFGEVSNDDVCDFIDQYIVKYRQITNWRTLYNCCKTTGIPHIAGESKHVDSVSLSLPVLKLITKDDPELDNTEELAVLGKVQLIAKELCLPELLEKAEVTEQEYIRALSVSNHGNVVVLALKEST